MKIPTQHKFRVKSFKLMQVLAITLLLTVGSQLPIPADAGFHPHHSFMANGSWRFDNFSTRELTPDTYFAAFSFKWYDYLNPVTAILYVAGKDLADEGNCFGMTALASKGESSDGTIPTRFSSSLTEDFFSNYPDRNTEISLDINTYQWQQWSTAFLVQWRASVRESLERTVDRISEDIAAGQYGVMTIYDTGLGHALIPLHVGGTDENTDIVVYDPNLPLNETSGNTLVINRATGNWRYHRDWSSSGGWHDTWTGSDEDLSYVTYTGGPAWTGLINDPVDLIVISGKNTDIEQVTDQDGRKLFKRVPARGQQDVDYSATGLGGDVIPWIPLKAQKDDATKSSSLRNSDAGQPHTPEAPTPKRMIVSQHPMTQAMKAFKTMTERYAAEYEADSKIFFVLNQNLKLRFDLAAMLKQGSQVKGQPPISRSITQQGNTLNLVAGNRTRTVQFKFSPRKTGGSIKPSATFPVGDPASNIRIQTRSSASMQTDLSITDIEKNTHEVNIENLQALPVKGNSRTIVRRTKTGRYEISGAGLKLEKTIKRERLGKDGIVRELEPIIAKVR